MPEFVLAAGVPASPDFLQLVLDTSLTGTMLLRPVYDPAAPTTIADFSWDYLNPAAQRMLHLPAQPPASLLTGFPTARAAGVFDFYCQAFHAGQVGHRQNDYLADGLDGYYSLVAQRYGEVLLVQFTDANDQARSPLEQALRESQAREQAARTEAERQRQELQRVFEQAPVAIAVYRGPHYIIELANPTVCRLWGRTPAQLLGKGLFEALPEVAGLGFEELLDQVLATGEPHVAHAMPAVHERAGRRDTVYWDFVYVPLHEEDGRRYGVMVVATEVTAQVLARQQAAQLTQELEARVRERTQQLAEQQGLLSQILGQVPAAIATLRGPTHRFTFFNEQYQLMNNHRTVLGATVADVVPEATEQGFVALLDEVYRTGQPYVGSEVPVWLRQAEGVSAPYYVNFRYQPLHDEAGQVQGILIFAVDVTLQVLARQQNEALQAEVLAQAQAQGQAREAFYQVFEQTPAPVSLLRGPQYRFEYVNPAYQRVFAGRSLVGLDFIEALPDAAAQGYLTLLDRVYATGETYFGDEIPFVNEPAEGPARTLYFNFTYQAYRENGQIVGISSFAFDVTEQVLARQRQQAQELLMGAVFEQAPVAIAIFRGPQYVIELANSSVCALWGRTPAQALGTPLFELLPEAAGQGFEQLLDQVRATGEPFVARELPSFIERAGRRDTVHWNFVYAPLPAADGTTERIMVVAAEVTEQVRARQQVQDLNEALTTTNRELHESNQQLTRSNTDLDSFVYAASHDLKAPITNIEGLLNALRDYLPTKAQEPMVPRLVSMMEGAIARFQQTVSHLTDISHLQTAGQLAAGAVDLPAVLEGVRLDLLPLLESTQAELRLDLEACPDLRFSVKSLRSVLFNLLSNAVKYRLPGRAPVVRVRAHCTPAHLVLTVQDNGLGLSEAQQAQLFTMFKRLHDHVEGSGVGLYLIKRTIENAGGTIAVASEPGVGSTFTVTLPRA